MSYHKNSNGNRGLLILNVLVGVLFFGYFGLLEVNYCLSADDYAGIDYASQGIPGFNFAWHFYWAWEGPFLTHFIHGLFMWLVSIGVPPFLVLGSVKLGLVASSMAVVSAISHRYDLNLNRTESVFTAFVFTIVLYLISPQPTQIWHWLTGMLYLYPVIFMMLGMAAIIRGNLLLAILPMAVVMQSRATYAALTFGFLFLLFLIMWFRKEQGRSKWLTLTAFSLLFLILYLIAPGNYVRLTEHGNSTPFLTTQFQVGLRNLFVSFNIAKMDRVVLGLAAVLPIVGASITIPRPKHNWMLAIPAFVYLFFVLVHEALFVFITGYHEWERVLSLHSFLFLSITWIYAFWAFGLVPEGLRTKLRPFALIGMFGLVFNLFHGFQNELKMAQELKEKYDVRLEAILHHDVAGDTLYVNPMNYEGILYFNGFSTDPDHWVNKDFAKAYGLDHKVAITKKEE